MLLPRFAGAIAIVRSGGALIASAPNTLTLKYFVSSEAEYDWFRVFIDGVQVFQASGGGQWATWTSSPFSTAGEYNIRMQYSKDGSVSAGEDAVWVDDIKWSSGGGTQSFEAGIPADWAQDAFKPWVLSTQRATTGTYSLKSGLIVNADHGQTSGIEFKVKLT